MCLCKKEKGVKAVSGDCLSTNLNLVKLVKKKEASSVTQPEGSLHCYTRQMVVPDSFSQSSKLDGVLVCFLEKAYGRILLQEVSDISNQGVRSSLALQVAT